MWLTGRAHSRGQEARWDVLRRMWCPFPGRSTLDGHDRGDSIIGRTQPSNGLTVARHAEKTRRASRQAHHHGPLPERHGPELGEAEVDRAVRDEIDRGESQFYIVVPMTLPEHEARLVPEASPWAGRDRTPTWSVPTKAARRAGRVRWTSRAAASPADEVR